MKFEVKKYIPFIFLALLLGVMALSNPGENQFKSFIKAQLTKKKFTDKDLENNLEYSKTGNYIIFSQYNFQIIDYGVPMEGNYIGVFGGFIPLGSYANENQ